MKSLVEVEAQEEGVGNALDLFERSPREGNIEHSIGTTVAYRFSFPEANWHFEAAPAFYNDLF